MAREATSPEFLTSCAGGAEKATPVRPLLVERRTAFVPGALGGVSRRRVRGLDLIRRCLRSTSRRGSLT